MVSKLSNLLGFLADIDATMGDKDEISTADVVRLGEQYGLSPQRAGNYLTQLAKWGEVERVFRSGRGRSVTFCNKEAK
jgi:hypothetical protein